MTDYFHVCKSDYQESECSKQITSIFLNFLVTGNYKGRTEEVVSLAMLMLKMAATDTVPPFLTHTFDEVSV